MLSARQWTCSASQRPVTEGHSSAGCGQTVPGATINSVLCRSVNGYGYYRCSANADLHVWGWSYRLQEWIHTWVCWPCVFEIHSEHPEWFIAWHLHQPVCENDESKWVTAHPRSWCELPGEAVTTEAFQVAYA